MEGKIHHYVYGITHKWSCKKYIGVRSCDIECNLDIGKLYFSSSLDKDFMEEQRYHPERFIYEVLQVFDTREKAMIYETELHERYDVANNSDFYNKCKSTSTGFGCGVGVNHPYYGKSPSEERVKAQAESLRKYYDKIRNDPIQSKLLSESRSRGNAKVNNCPQRLRKKKENQRKASLETQNEIRNDPERIKIRSEKLARLRFVKVDQFDLEGNFLKSFPSLQEAAKYIGYSGVGGISKCINGGLKTYKGFIWKRSA